MHADAIAIIRRELDHLTSTDPAVRRSSLATIRQQVDAIDRIETKRAGDRLAVFSDPALPATTPWGPVGASYYSRAHFYAAHPDLEGGWEGSELGTAPFGVDVANRRDAWLVVFCANRRDFARAFAAPSDVVGQVVGFHHSSGCLYEFGSRMTFEECERAYGA